MVYLRQFHPREWIQLVRDEGVTTATVVPTMLDRIVSALEPNPSNCRRCATSPTAARR